MDINVRALIMIYSYLTFAKILNNQCRTQHIELFVYSNEVRIFARPKKTKKGNIALKILVIIYNRMSTMLILHIYHHSENGDIGACSF